MPFWLWGVSATFHPARFTTLQTAVSCVRIGHRTRAVNRVWLAEAALFCAGFSPPWLPTMDARCIVLIPLSTYGSLKEQSLAPFKGAPALSRVQQRRLWLVTMRRRGAALLRRLQALPPTAWHQAGSAIPTRRHPHSRSVEETTRLHGDAGPRRQVAVDGWGQPQPTRFVSHNFDGSARDRITRSTGRHGVEDSLGSRIHVLPLACLASAVRRNVAVDVALTVLAQGCYRWLATQWYGCDKAKPK